LNKINKEKLNNSSFDQSDEIITLMDIILVLASQIRVILITPTILCVLAIIYVLLFLKPTFTSTAKIMSSSTGGNVSQAAGIAAQFGINLPTGQSETKWVYPEIIKSRTLARSMLRRKFDTDKFGSQKTLFQILTYENENTENDLSRRENLAINKLLGMIDVSEDIKTSIVTLNVKGSEPKFVAELNQVLIEELDTHQRNYNKAKTTDTKKFIQGRIIDVEKELMAAEEDLKVFRDRNRRIENSPTLKLEQQRLNREVTVLTGVFTTLKQQYETTKIEEVKESDYVVILDAPNVPIFTSNSKREIVTIIGLLGVLLGIIIAFFRDYIDKSPPKEKEKFHRAQSIIFNYFKKVLPKRYLY
tara:strand:+ start:808 stop:1884 length:1077 start_codon:yes stop_codon:yes gene_type:complete